MIRTFKPVLRDLWFREKLLSDEQTMSYNAAWRGAFQRKNGKGGFLLGLKFPNINDIIAICTKLILKPLLVKLPITTMSKEKNIFAT